MQVARLTAKHYFFAAVAIGTVFVFYYYELFFFHAKTDPEWIHLRPVGNWIYLHGLPGAIALLAAPIQFSTRVRNKFPVFHRRTGYLYFLGVMIACPLGMFVARSLSSDPIDYTISWIHGGSWMLCTIVAIVLVRKGDIARHREWMIRSYSWGLIFLTARILLKVLPFAPGSSAATAVIWMCMGTAMTFPQLIINWKQIFGSAARPIAQQRAAASGD